MHGNDTKQIVGEREYYMHPKAESKGWFSWLPFFGSKPQQPDQPVVCCPVHPRRTFGPWIWKAEALALKQAKEGRVLLQTEAKGPQGNFYWVTDAQDFMGREQLKEPWRLTKDASQKQTNMEASMTAAVGCPWMRQREVLTTRALPAGIGGERVPGLAAKYALSVESSLDNLYTAHTASGNAGTRDPAEATVTRADVDEEADEDIPEAFVPDCIPASGVPETAIPEGPAGITTDLKELLAPHVAGAIIEMVYGANTGDFWREFLFCWAKRKGPHGQQHMSFLDGMPSSTEYAPKLAAFVEAAIKQRNTDSRDPLAPGSCSLLQGLAHDATTTGATTTGGGGGEKHFLSQAEISSNCISFMTAGFETTFSVVMWTIIALGSKKHAALRKKVQAECAMLETSEALRSEHMDLLRSLKKAAMKGAPLPSSLYDDPAASPKNDLLVRCIAETLTMFPPVWSLPRAQAFAGGEGCVLGRGPKVSRRRMDGRPLSMNGVTEDWPKAWDPCRVRPWGSSIHAFGVGERACPAGTAALLIAWTMLRTLLRQWDFEEAEEGHAVETAYLNPVLLTAGPQYVHIRAVTAPQPAPRYTM